MDLDTDTYADQNALPLEVDILDRKLVGQRHLGNIPKQLASEQSLWTDNRGQNQGYGVFRVRWQVKRRSEYELTLQRLMEG